jgi:hypothetical protein
MIVGPPPTHSRLKRRLREFWDARFAGYFLGRLPFVIIEEPGAFSKPFTYDSNAVYVVWWYEVIGKWRIGDAGSFISKWTTDCSDEVFLSGASNAC